MTVFALIDCNNFYASCERLFQPQLKNKPIVVLSNNDGCIIARSNEAKDLGIPMGEPYFKAKHIIEQNDVAVFSSNYTLYGDMSRRVMATISDIVDVHDIEIYSIDEAFVDLTCYPNPYEFAKRIKEQVTSWTGIPISIGLGTSKTLAKVASHVAKKYKSYGGVFYIDSDERRQKVLAATDVGDVWGIGRNGAKKLNSYRIKTALDFSNQSDAFVRKIMSITGLKTLKELRGESCIDLEPNEEDKKMITVSRSFGRKINDKASVMQALAHFTERAGEKLRSQNLNAKEACIVLYKELSASGVANYKDNCLIEFEYATNNTLDLMKGVSAAFDKIYRDGQTYKKCGVHLFKLSKNSGANIDLFDVRDLKKSDSLMEGFDSINATHGSNTIKTASSLGKGAWIAKKDKKSFCYTTRWDELPVVR